MMTRQIILDNARKDYELAHAIVADPSRATEEATRIHENMGDAKRRKESVALTAAELRTTSAKVVRGGKGATYVIKRRRNDGDPTLIDVTIGCMLMNMRGEGYVALFTSDDV